jgi:hypothetical protein
MSHKGGRPVANSFMSVDEYRDIIATLGLTAETAAEFLRIDRATSFRYAGGHGSIPYATAELLRILRQPARALALRDWLIRNCSAAVDRTRPA